VLVVATLGATALYLLFVWLLAAAGAAWMSDRKGYGERVGLTFGLILSLVGFLLVCLLPGRPGSAWREEGVLPRRRAGGEADSEGPPAGAASEGRPAGAASEGPPAGADSEGPPAGAASEGPPAEAGSTPAD